MKRSDGLLAFALILSSAHGCGATLRAERYRDELIACASRAKTLEASKACRAEVEKKYADDGGAPP